VSVINDDDKESSALTTAEHDDLSYIDEDRNQYGDLLLITSITRWDYPVFELSDRCPDTLLSRVSFHSNNTTATNKNNNNSYNMLITILTTKFLFTTTHREAIT